MNGRRAAVGAFVVVLTFGLLPVRVGYATTPTARSRPAETCSDGTMDTTTLPPESGLRSLLRLSDGRILGVGGVRGASEGSRKVRTLQAVRSHGEWAFSSSLASDGDWASLERLAQAPNGTVWGAGIRYISSRVLRPRVSRLSTSGWHDTHITDAHGIATGIAIDPGGTIWVTTAETGHGRPEAHLYVRRSESWQRVDLPSIAGSERFAAVAAPSRTVTLVAGTSVGATGVHPVVLRRSGGAWTRETVATATGQQVQINDVLARRGEQASIVGWQLSPLPMHPVAFRRDADGVWRPDDPIGATGVAGVAIHLATVSEARLLSGSSFLAAFDRWVPALSGPVDATWRMVPQAGLFPGAVVGDPTADGWVVLSRTYRAGPAAVRPAVVTRLCDAAPIGDPALRRALQRQHRAEVRREVARTKRAARRELRRSKQALARRGSQLGPASAADRAIRGKLSFRDIAADLGLPVWSGTYGISQGDLDGDGDRDLVWSRHGGPLAIYLREGGGYVAFTPTGIVPADRHTCVAGRFDADDHHDIACVTGGQGGFGLTSNELYLDPTAETTRDQGTERGLTDPTARGRRMVAFDADGDGDLDLYVANEERMDGAPVINRLLLNDGDANFTWSIRSRLTSSFGQSIPRPADLDLDGDQDLVVALHDEGGHGKAIHLYRNDGSGVFDDVARSSGLTPIGETDLAVAQLDGSGRPEIIQLAPGRLVASRWDGKHYVRFLDRTVMDAALVAPADVDGDGDKDLYVVSGPGGKNGQDLVLRNDGTGTGWDAISVPGTGRDHPDAVLATDLDEDDRDEIILLAGRNGAGPFRVIDAVKAAAP